MNKEQNSGENQQTPKAPQGKQVESAETDQNSEEVTRSVQDEASPLDFGPETALMW